MFEKVAKSAAEGGHLAPECHLTDPSLKFSSKSIADTLYSL